MSKLSTQKMYLSKIKVLRDKYNIGDLSDYESVINIIGKLDDCKNFICAILWFDTCICKNLVSGIEQKIPLNILDMYKGKLNMINKKINIDSGKSIMSPKQKKVYCDWKELINIRNNLLNKNIYDIDVFIFALYTLIPPRRVKDYVYMYFMNDNLFEEDMNKNYCVNTDDKMYFIFNVYKNEDCAGMIKKYSIPENLRNIILKYVKDNNIENGAKLINLKNESYLCSKIHKIMEKYTGKSLGVQMLRHIFSSWVEFHSTDISKNDRIKFALLMGHSYAQNTSYSKHLDIEYNHNKKYFLKETEEMRNIKIFHENYVDL
jgi:hypothetical protein